MLLRYRLTSLLLLSSLLTTACGGSNDTSDSQIPEGTNQASNTITPTPTPNNTPSPSNNPVFDDTRTEITQQEFENKVALWDEQEALAFQLHVNYENIDYGSDYSITGDGDIYGSGYCELLSDYSPYEENTDDNLFALDDPDICGSSGNSTTKYYRVTEDQYVTEFLCDNKVALYISTSKILGKNKYDFGQLVVTSDLHEELNFSAGVCGSVGKIDAIANSTTYDIQNETIGESTINLLASYDTQQFIEIRMEFFQGSLDAGDYFVLDDLDFMIQSHAHDWDPYFPFYEYASSGVVTITEFNGARASGSYNVTMESGETLLGSFEVDFSDPQYDFGPVAPLPQISLPAPAPTPITSPMPVPTTDPSPSPTPINEGEILEHESFATIITDQNEMTGQWAVSYNQEDTDQIESLIIIKNDGTANLRYVLHNGEYSEACSYEFFQTTLTHLGGNLFGDFPYPLTVFEETYFAGFDSDDNLVLINSEETETFVLPPTEIPLCSEL